jgi:hypothetical protein
MHRERRSTDPSLGARAKGWWKTFLRCVEVLDNSGFDDMADRMRAVEDNSRN